MILGGRTETAGKADLGRGRRGGRADRGRAPISAPNPHVHDDRQLGELHPPTGVIRLEDVVALAIEELGAEPLCEDWRTVPGA